MCLRVLAAGGSEMFCNICAGIFLGLVLAVAGSAGQLWLVCKVQSFSTHHISE